MLAPIREELSMPHLFEVVKRRVAREIGDLAAEFPPGYDVPAEADHRGREARPHPDLALAGLRATHSHRTAPRRSALSSKCFRRRMSTLHVFIFVEELSDHNISNVYGSHCSTKKQNRNSAHKYM